MTKRDDITVHCVPPWMFRRLAPYCAEMLTRGASVAGDMGPDAVERIERAGSREAAVDAVARFAAELKAPLRRGGNEA